MTRITTSALALILAAGPLAAESHKTDGAAKMKDKGQQAQSEQMKAEGETKTAAVDKDSQDLSDESLIRTRDITDGKIYSMNASGQNDEWDAEMSYDKVDENWDQIGTIEDIVLNEKGEMRGMVAEVGGFLDIADKHVFVPLKDIKLVPVDDATYAMVTPYTEEKLEELEGVDEGFWN